MSSSETASPGAYRATVLVVGDLGRSPRMLNQALALADNGAEVSLAGYHDSSIDPAVAGHPRIHVYFLARGKTAAAGAGRLAFLAVSGLRFAFLHFQLLRLLLARTPRANAVLVQNPPGVPALLVAWICCRLRGSRLVIDWHNLGYSMLALKLGEDHLVVRFTRAWERIFGRHADAHMCVSAAMKRFLEDDFGLRDVAILYDAPNPAAHAIPLADRGTAARMLLERCGIALESGTAVLLSPTSWSADEDMGLLLDALEAWDSQSPATFRLMMLIAGRGPLRERFERRIRGLRMHRVEIRTLFLEPQDYRKLLGVAHLGICMHRSSSGLDLPIKLMDFFGARTPVCAFDYGPCLRERLDPDRTGALFRTSDELAAALDRLLTGFPQRPTALEQMQEIIEATMTETWTGAWRRSGAKLF